MTACMHVYLHAGQTRPCPPPLHWRPTWTFLQKERQEPGHSLKDAKLRLVRKQEVWMETKN